MTIFAMPRILFFCALALGLTFSSCDRDKDKVAPQLPETSDARDHAVGVYTYTMEWHDISSGVPVAIPEVEMITGRVELKKNNQNNRTIKLYENSELFISFDDVYATQEGFSFNHSWLELPFDGEVYSFFGHDTFMMDGEEEAGVYYKAAEELNFAFFVEIENQDLTLTFKGQKVN